MNFPSLISFEMCSYARIQKGAVCIPERELCILIGRRYTQIPKVLERVPRPLCVYHGIIFISLPRTNTIHKLRHF